MDTNGSVSLQTCFHLGDPTFHRASQRFTMNLITAIVNIITAPVAVVINALVTIAVFRLLPTTYSFKSTDWLFGPDVLMFLLL